MVSAVWGWTFVLVKDAISQYPPLPFLAFRFGVALVALALVVRRLPARSVLLPGTLLGLVLFGGYLSQTEGLRWTSPGTAGLLTGLYVVFTPLIERALGEPVGIRTLVAVVVALAGTALLTGQGAGGSGLGEALMVVCAICFALQIVLLSRWGPRLPPLELALVQVAVGAALFGMLGAGEYRLPTGQVWLAVGVTGLVASAVALWVQTWAQQHLSASRAAVIMALEPAWALLFSVLLAGQRLGALQATGAALVLAAVIGQELSGWVLPVGSGRGTGLRAGG